MNLDTSTLTSMLGGVIRSVLILAFGGLVGAGLITQDQVSAIAGAVAVIVVTLWSVWQKKQAADNHNATVVKVANAVANSPSSVTQVIEAAKAGKL